MKILLKTILIAAIIVCPFFARAQNTEDAQGARNKFYQAEVIEVIKEQTTELSDGSSARQQDLKLKGLEGEIKNKEIIFNGIGNYDVAGKNLYKTGDKVLVIQSLDFEGNPSYYITDFVRTNTLWWLATAFILSLIVIGGFKGFRSILSLIFTFLVIVKYIIPKILDGADPITITLIGSFLILLLIIYVTEGFKKRSHIAVLSIFISLVITVFLSWFFVNLTKLTGVSSEETGFLVELAGRIINFKGLLLAGIIIGVLGVLDDIVIAQVATVEQIEAVDPSLSRMELFKRSYEVGISHISSMTNTLFLAYAGVSMPLLILFLSGQSAFSDWTQIINNEAIATEIVRTLAGSIGLILSVPISTTIAVWWVKAGNTEYKK